MRLHRTCVCCFIPATPFSIRAQGAAATALTFFVCMWDRATLACATRGKVELHCVAGWASVSHQICLLSDQASGLCLSSHDEGGDILWTDFAKQESRRPVP
jgi:hypothetical protein